MSAVFGIVSGRLDDREWGSRPSRRDRVRSGNKVAMRFVKETRIAAPPSAVFAFHEAPGALLRVSPPWERVERIAGGDSIQTGSRVVLRVWLGPWPVVWEAEHTEYQPGRMFADRQARGPFASWHHRHLFLDDGAGGTLMRDEVDYELPLGRLGRLLAGGLVEGKLRTMFDHRHEATRRIVEAGDFPAPPR
jgi:ligand-binding SRPBCC domain-containing protein